MLFHFTISVFFAFINFNEATTASNFSNGTPINGVAIVGGEIYVIRENQTSVDAYKTNNFELIFSLSLPQTVGPIDLTGLSNQQNLFMLDSSNQGQLIRLATNHKFSKSTYNVTDMTSSTALSMAQDLHIIVTKPAQNLFEEYSGTGINPKVIRLQNITGLRHAIKVNSKEYAVSFGSNSSETHGVCLVDALGKTTKCLSGPPGNGTLQFNSPERIMLAQNEKILVADRKNLRIVELSKGLVSSKVIASKVDGLASPTRMSYDTYKKILYVASNEEDGKTGRFVKGRIFTFSYP